MLQFGVPTGAVTAPVAAAPTNLAATAANTQVQLSWSSVGGASTYNVYSTTSAVISLSSATKVSGLSTAGTVVTGLTNGTTYYFVVTEVTGGTESAVSNEVSATPFIPIATTPVLSAYVPSQYVAKLYTEGLGRAPDQAGWQSMMTALLASGCSASAMETMGVASKTIFDAAEFKTANPDAQSQTVAMVRAILNRDPTAADLTLYEGKLNSGTTTANVAAGIYTGTEFATLATTICTSTMSWQLTVGSTATTTVYNADYSFGTTPAPTLNLLTSGISTYAALVSALSAAKTGSVVALAQAAMIPVTAQINVPTGVTLETMGTPEPNNYTQMARLVRASSYDGSVVQVSSEGTLQNVWVDGQRSILGYYKNTYDQANVLSASGTGITVANNKSSDPRVGQTWSRMGLTRGVRVRLRFRAIC